jgi:uncharacterized coiled-coil protein SlyX
VVIKTGIPPSLNSYSPDQLNELRRILIAPYLEQMAELQARLYYLERQGVERQATIATLEAQLAEHHTIFENLEPIISVIVTQTLKEAHEELTQALAPVVGPAIKTQVKVAREDIIDALYPVIGSTITRSITEALRSLTQTIDSTVKRTFSFKGLKRKVTAKATGISESTLLLRESIPFSVREVFLIHSESGLLVSHVSTKTKNETAEPEAEDRDLVSGMLTAIRDFVKESFKTQSVDNEQSQLNEIKYGELTILIEPSRYVYAAVVFAGVASPNYSSRVREVLGWIHGGYAKRLRLFAESGENSQLNKLSDLLYTLIAKSA